MEGIKTSLSKFIKKPFPIWENKLSRLLVNDQWNRFAQQNITIKNYNIANCLLKQTAISVSKIELANLPSAIYIELPNIELLSPFYTEHGLKPMTAIQLQEIGGLEHLQQALKMLDKVPGVLGCISTIISSVQCLHAHDPDFDISYSHPQIPFSIFVSVTGDISPVSIIRLGESILHEAMHLKLTLIENVSPIVSLNSTVSFYSPWRNELRPLRGVLHGIFVFRTIQEFYKQLLLAIISTEELDFVKYRIDQIESELMLLKEFPNSESLTIDGASLSANLLPLN